MDFRPKLWLGVGTAVLASSATTNAVALDDAAGNGGMFTLAKVRGAGGEGGEGGETGARRPRAPKSKSKAQDHKGSAPSRPLGAGGEGGEGGERGAPHVLPRGGQGGEGGEAGVNTRYIFGFTEGADTERRGELEFENDTTGRFEKREGFYTALQNKTEIEYGVTNDLMVEFAGFAQAHRIRGVPDLDDVTQTRFDGFSGEVKYRFWDRRSAPLGFAISAEPELRLHSETSGEREDAYGVELKAYADKELVPNKLFIAGNLLYEPEAVRAIDTDPDTGQPFAKWEHESMFGVSGAIAGAIAPNVFLGAEVRHLRQYDGMGLNRLEGQATFVGPTLSVRFSPRALIQAAYSVQVAGRAVDDPNHGLDLTNFEKHNARLRFVYEF
jgi:hypothetical protein